MRSVNLYYVYDNINECAITNIIPAANDLVAALGFRDSFIKCKEKRPYIAYDLVRFAKVSVTEDGEFFLSDDKDNDQVKRILGREIMDFISAEYKKLDIDDDFVEEKEE